MGDIVSRCCAITDSDSPRTQSEPALASHKTNIPAIEQTIASLPSAENGCLRDKCRRVAFCFGSLADMLFHYQVSVWANSGGLKRFVPKGLLGPEKNTKLLGRSSDDRRKRFRKSRPNLWVLKNLVHRIVEFLNYWSGSSCRRYDPAATNSIAASRSV
jgi:hypothetical protein